MHQAQDWSQLYFCRPPPNGELNRILERKFDQDVKVYIIVYKEVTQTMSKLTKMSLESVSVQVVATPR
ncbi:hypothetical protein E1B28_003071 [Marasmius oreades]|uniref:Uncharacterized protein n=1 Tax=Marasmius oreades TaxID=181124 RepID=A0A9P7RLS8_9AGAR|nr:uncharacterized protein E1B28_003071 [Marasmius oreades]KAG7085510.1 hypothetical protein E1B28_003071 [Marasmius oreades]